MFHSCLKYIHTYLAPYFTSYVLVFIIDYKQYHKILPFALTLFALILNVPISNFITSAILNNLPDVGYSVLPF